MLRWDLMVSGGARRKRLCGAQVSSSLSIPALVDAFDAHDEALVDIGAGGDGIARHPVVFAEFALFGGEQGQDGGERVDAEVLAGRDAQLGAFGEFEIVADFETADGAALNALNGDAQVVEFEGSVHVSPG